MKAEDIIACIGVGIIAILIIGWAIGYFYFINPMNNFCEEKGFDGYKEYRNIEGIRNVQCCNEGTQKMVVNEDRTGFERIDHETDCKVFEMEKEK